MPKSGGFLTRKQIASGFLIRFPKSVNRRNCIAVGLCFVRIIYHLYHQYSSCSCNWFDYVGINFEI
jgi:hypothetical protein